MTTIYLDATSPTCIYDNDLQAYLHDIGKYPLLSKAQERELAQHIEAGKQMEAYAVLYAQDGTEYGVTRERIRQIANHALHKLQPLLAEVVRRTGVAV